MTEDKYEVQSCVPEAAIRVCSTKVPQLTLKITLSSLAMREEHSTREEGIDPIPHPFLCLLFRRMLPQLLFDLYMTTEGPRERKRKKVILECKSMKVLWHLSFIWERMIHWEGWKLRSKQGKKDKGWDGSGSSVVEIGDSQCRMFSAEDVLG